MPCSCTVCCIFFQITFQDETCKTACTKKYDEKSVNDEKLGFVKNAIRLNYQHHWWVFPEINASRSVGRSILGMRGGGRCTYSSYNQTDCRKCYSSRNSNSTKLYKSTPPSTQLLLSIWNMFLHSTLGSLTICLWHGVIKWVPLMHVKFTVPLDSLLVATSIVMEIRKMLVLFRCVKR